MADEAAAALAGIDRVLSQKPRADGGTLSEVAVHLASWRDRLTTEHRAGASRVPLDHVNAAISIVLATHFPLGEIPWHELEAARAWLVTAQSEGEPP